MGPLNAFDDLARLADIFHAARGAFDELFGVGSITEPGRERLATETMAHLDRVEAGFRAALRTSSTSREDLRLLIGRGGLRPLPARDAPEARAALIEAMQALSGAGGPRHIEMRAGVELTAVEHARLTLGLMPLLSAETGQARHGRPYADIAPPRDPIEFVARVEEIERTVWQAALGVPGAFHDARWRRVYAFFDSGERICSGTGWQA